jgi:hypothetical protein
MVPWTAESRGDPNALGSSRQPCRKKCRSKMPLKNVAQNIAEKY